MSEEVVVLIAMGFGCRTGALLGEGSVLFMIMVVEGKFEQLQLVSPIRFFCCTCHLSL